MLDHPPLLLRTTETNEENTSSKNQRFFDHFVIFFKRQLSKWRGHGKRNLKGGVVVFYNPQQSL